MQKLALIAVLASGCAKTDSSDLLTSGIYAAIVAEANGDGTTDVQATLYVGNPINFNFVELTGDDVLVASFGAQEKEMTEAQLLNVVSHHASFNSDNEGDQFQVSLDRSVDRGAPNSFAVLPPKFTLDPLASTTASRAANLTLRWSPIDANSQIRWQVEGDCIELEAQTETSDEGTVTIEANRLRKRMGEGVPDECQMTIEVTRSKAGQLDPGYGKGGVIEGTQVRTLIVTTTP